MIAPMTKYSFILLQGEQEGFLSQLQEIGLVDITRSTKPCDERSGKIKADIELIEGLIQGISNVHLPEGIEPIAFNGDIVRMAGGMLMRYADDTSDIEALRKEIKHLKVWGNYDHDMLQVLADAGVPLHFHVLTTKAYDEKWAEEYPLTEVHRTKSHVWFVVAGEDPLPGEVPAPENTAAYKEEYLKDKEKHLDKVMRKIAGLKLQLPKLEEMRREAYAQLDLYLAGAAAVPAAEDTIVTLVGHAPSESDESISAALDAAGVFYLKEEAQVADNPPIVFRNNWFVRQFEPLTDMYGRPAYDGFDPTPFISCFFLLFFALCMGDAGYGLILVAAGLAMRKSESFGGMAPLVTLLGIGTVIVGFFLHTFFSIDIAQWKIFEPIKGIFLPDEIGGYAGGMVLSIIIGIIHLSLAMLVKTFFQIRNNGLAASLGTLGWTLLIVGGVCVGALSLMGVLDSELTKWIIIVLGIVSAIGIFPLNNPDRNKFANVGMGLWDTYNTVTGLLGDVLSYLRLYALGLAGSMLGMAFNDMGAMVLGDGSSPLLWIPFVLLVLIGHTLNIAMCALGAFVHPLRLNFLEFFKNSGYEAAGRDYNPLKK